MNSITKRWLTGSLLITLIALILAEAVFLVANRQSYYSGVEQAILSRFFQHFRPAEDERGPHRRRHRPGPQPGAAPDGGAVRRQGQI